MNHQNNNKLTRPRLYEKVMKLSKLENTLLNVGFHCIEVVSIFLFMTNFKSKNENILFCSTLSINPVVFLSSWVHGCSSKYRQTI